MVDISHEENKAISTQLVIDQMCLNSDVLGIIKSFIFHDKKMYQEKKLEQKIRKDNLMRIIKETMGYSVDEYLDEGFGHWAIWLPIPQAEDEDDLQMQASSCLKCGKYLQVGNILLENAIQNNAYIMCIDGKH